MPLNFPSGPTSGATYTYGSNTWQWNGYAWDTVSPNLVNTLNGATGNLSITGSANQVTVSGLTSFAIGLTNNVQITSSLTISGGTAWHSLNDGAGSGLDADLVRGVAGQRFIENLQTGLLYGGLISVNAGNTGQVNISAGTGIIVNPGASLTAMPNPTISTVNWAGMTGVTLSGLTSSDETWLAIDSIGSLIQTNVAFTDAQYSSQIPLGAVLHLSRTYIQLVKGYPHVSYAQPEQFDPFIRAFGNLKLSGHEISANGANLTVNRSAGKAYAMGRNYSNDPNNPNIVTDTSAIPVTTIYHFYRNGSGAFTTTIDGAIIPGSLDNGTGTLGTVTPAKFTIQRLFYLPDQPTLLGVYYGRQEYNSISDALANIPFEEFSESESTATQGIFCGWLIVRGNTTALNDTAEAKFVNAGLFRNTANIGGGGLAIASIDDLNDVTTTTPTNNQVLRWNSGTLQWVNSDASSLAVSSFNGLTGAVTGITSGGTNVFTGLNTFNAGISVTGVATFTDNVNFIGFTSGLEIVMDSPTITMGDVFGGGDQVKLIIDNGTVDISAYGTLRQYGGQGIVTNSNLAGTTASFSGLVSSSAGFSGAGSNLTNIVKTFNGLSGAVSFAVPLATTGSTGVASFNFEDFTVGATGHVRIKTGINATNIIVLGSGGTGGIGKLPAVDGSALLEVNAAYLNGKTNSQITDGGTF